MHPYLTRGDAARVAEAVLAGAGRLARHRVFPKPADAACNRRNVDDRG